MGRDLKLTTKKRNHIQCQNTLMCRGKAKSGCASTTHDVQLRRNESSRAGYENKELSLRKKKNGGQRGLKT